MADTATTFSDRTDCPDLRSPANTKRSDVFILNGEMLIEGDWD